MTRHMIYVTIIFCSIIAIFGIWRVLRTTPPGKAQITLHPHSHMSPAGYQCLHKILPHIIHACSNTHTKLAHIKEIFGHVDNLTMRWKNPWHVHCTIYTSPPVLYIQRNEHEDILTANGSCVPAKIMPKHITEKLPRMYWRSNEPPENERQNILHLYHSIPCNWWNQYVVQWHTSHDIRLHSRNSNHAHIRTTSDRNIDTKLHNQISYIERNEHTKQSHKSNMWIDIRFPRYAIIYPKIQGR